MMERNMESEVPAPLVDKVNVVAETAVDRSCPSKKNKEKVPKRIHKAEREKLKREHLNDLFLDLANALELTQENNGKASILNEATRILRDMLCQIENLKKENATLLSESHYVSAEKNELREENSALEAQIKKLHDELEARLAQCKHNLNVPPPEVEQVKLTSHFPGDCLRLPATEPPLQQAPSVFVVPLHPDLQAYTVSDTSPLVSKPNSQVSKPHARYPTPEDSWPSQLLGNQTISGNKF